MRCGAAALLLPACAALWAPPRSGELYSVTCGNASSPGAAPACELKAGRVAAAAAWGRFEDATQSLGMSRLSVSTGAGHPNGAQAFAAGFLEGAVSVNQTLLFCETFDIFALYPLLKLTNVWRFAERWDAWMAGMEAAEGGSDPYWAHAALLRAQMAGIVAGHNAWVGDRRRHIDAGLLLLINSVTEMPDMLLAAGGAVAAAGGDAATRARARAATERAVAAFRQLGHCSGLVKVLPGNSDVEFAHCTWSAYPAMVRVWKRYDLAFDVPGLPPAPVVFTSYPLFVWSMDDFYVNGHQVAVFETTNDVYDRGLWARVRPEGCVLTWARAALAARTAPSAAAWARTFARYSSGTYNNQYVALDYKLFESGGGLKDGALWVVETAPGLVHAEERTAALRGDTYWASYNIPNFTDVYNVSGYPAKRAAKAGADADALSHDACARARIFRRDHASVVDRASMRRLMRYNDYKNDPLALGSPINAISARFDLPGPRSELDVGIPLPGGGIDCKITSAAQVASLQFDSVCGPTHDTQPVFRWDAGLWGAYPHKGQPDVLDFPWVADAMGVDY